MARDFTRVYIDGDLRAHLLDELLSPNSPNAALCGRMPAAYPGLWLGTGSQEEHEHALELRLCVPCDIARVGSLGVKR